MTIRFLKGEELTARKMNDLSAVAHRGAVRGNLQRSPDGALAGIGNTQNYIPQFVPLYPERLTGTSLIVRGGAWEHYTGDTRSITSLTCDGGASRNPEDVKTLTPTLAASTAYSVYLELTTGAGTLTANVIDTASFPADAAGKRRYLLAEFTTSAAATIPDIDPLNGDLITGQAEANEDHTAGDGITGSIYNGSTARTWSVDYEDDSPADVAGSGSAGVGTELARGDHAHRAPHWDEMQLAGEDVNLTSDTDNTDVLNIGTSSVTWDEVKLYSRYVNIETTNSGNINIRGDGQVKVDAGSTGTAITAGTTTLQLDIYSSLSGFLKFSNLGTSVPSGSRQGGLAIDTNGNVYIDTSL